MEEVGKTTAVFPITEKGYKLAGALAQGLGKVVIYSPSSLKNGGLKRKVKEAFGKYRALIFISASGIAVRSIAPLLRGKDVDPAVVVVDEAGRFAISLLSGHLGGANRIAGRVAGLIGATPVITTATDLAGLPCAEDVAGAFSLKIEDPKKIKAVNSAILKGQTVLVVDNDGGRLKALKERFGVFKRFRFLKRLASGSNDYKAVILITPFTDPLPAGLNKNTLVLRPPEFVIGIGCGRGVGARDIDKAVSGVLRGAKVSRLSIRAISTIDLKKDEKGLLIYARDKGFKIEFFGSRELNSVKPPSGASMPAFKATGAEGVSEPSAMLSAGVKRIWLKKRKTGFVTVALARAPFTS